MPLIIDTAQAILTPAISKHYMVQTDHWLNAQFIADTTISLIDFKNKKRPEYWQSGMVFAEESRSWRHEFFPYYKANRADRPTAAGKVKFPFNKFFEHVPEAMNMIAENYGDRALRIRVFGAEGDDIIAVAAKWFHKRDPDELVGLISSDKDFKQLSKYIHSQYVPGSKDTKVEDAGFSGITHILEGDAADGIPKITQPDDWFVNKDAYLDYECAKLTPTFKKEFAALTEAERIAHPVYGDAYVRNKTLVCFDHIPKDIEAQVESKLERHFGLAAPTKMPKLHYLNYLKRLRTPH